MKNLILCFSALALLLVACKSDPKNAGAQADTEKPSAAPQYLAGHWFAMDFCSRSSQYGSVLAAMSNSHIPYAYGITFDPDNPDTVICYNGIESWALPVKYNVDTIELIGARPGKSVFLVYNSQIDKNITMFDGTSGTMQIDLFFKSKANTKDGYLAFSTALNHHLFNGTFFPIGKGGEDKKLQFTPGGYIMDWEPYDRYSVCTAGDCFVCGNNIDIITLRRAKVDNSEKMFGFRFSPQNDTLTFYNLVNTNPNEKGMYAVKGVAYRFRRQFATR